MYAIVLGFIATLLVYIGSGPVWVSVNFMSNACRNGWWINLLYINNFVPLTVENAVFVQAKRKPHTFKLLHYLLLNEFLVHGGDVVPG